MSLDTSGFQSAISSAVKMRKYSTLGSALLEVIFATSQMSSWALEILSNVSFAQNLLFVKPSSCFSRMRGKKTNFAVKFGARKMYTLHNPPEVL